jgi:hypothetical protein
MKLGLRRVSVDHQEIVAKASDGGFLANLKGALAATSFAGAVALAQRALSVKGLRAEFKEKVDDLKRGHEEEALKNENFRAQLTTDMGELKGMMKVIIGDRAKE